MHRDMPRIQTSEMRWPFLSMLSYSNPIALALRYPFPVPTLLRHVYRSHRTDDRLALAFVSIPTRHTGPAQLHTRRRLSTNIYRRRGLRVRIHELSRRNRLPHARFSPPVQCQFFPSTTPSTQPTSGSAREGATYQSKSKAVLGLNSNVLTGAADERRGRGLGEGLFVNGDGLCGTATEGGAGRCCEGAVGLGWSLREGVDCYGGDADEPGKSDGGMHCGSLETNRVDVVV